MSIDPHEATPERSANLKKGIAEFRKSYAARNARVRAESLVKSFFDDGDLEKCARSFGEDPAARIALESLPALKNMVPGLDAAMDPDGKAGREDGARVSLSQPTKFDDDKRERSGRSTMVR